MLKNIVLTEILVTAFYKSIDNNHVSSGCKWKIETYWESNIITKIKCMKEALIVKENQFHKY